jgi:hypothetical protein
MRGSFDTLKLPTNSKSKKLYRIQNYLSANNATSARPNNDKKSENKKLDTQESFHFLHELCVHLVTKRDSLIKLQT